MHHDINKIFACSDSTDFVISMISHLCDKSNYGDNMEKLSPAEQIFFICTILEQEVNNGGFDQFFCNSSGNFANRIVDAFLTIGAEEIASICKDALAAFPESLPEDWAERQEYLDETSTEEIQDILSACDDRFYEYPEDLENLCYQYALSHKEQFC